MGLASSWGPPSRRVSLFLHLDAPSAWIGLPPATFLTMCDPVFGRAANRWRTTSKPLPPSTHCGISSKIGPRIGGRLRNPNSGQCFTELRRRAGYVRRVGGGAGFERAVGRLLHVDDEERLTRWIEWLAQDQPPSELPPDTRDGRLQLMLHVVLGQRQRPVSERSVALSEFWGLPVREEYLELLSLLLDRTRANTRPMSPQSSIPLHSHATYGLYEVVAALGLINKDLLRETREGVIWAEADSTDLCSSPWKSPTQSTQRRPAIRTTRYPRPLSLGVSERDVLDVGNGEEIHPPPKPRNGSCALRSKPQGGLTPPNCTLRLSRRCALPPARI